ncbi:MAG: bifunctional ADP-dependent NAD(P)H-hydrate dehydratase/NAD(P)H-hydrate epimerase, partial [Chloroflexota bacterium]
MPKIVTTDQMRAIERAADAQGHSYAAMMERAGRAVAERVKQLLAGSEQPRVAVIVGPGNNGGDGLVAARILAQELEGASVGAFLLKLRGDDDDVFARAREHVIVVATQLE